MTAHVGWINSVHCRACGQSDWGIVDGSWTCACGKVMHTNPTADDAIQINIRQAQLARVTLGLTR